ERRLAQRRTPGGRRRCDRLPQALRARGRRARRRGFRRGAPRLCQRASPDDRLDGAHPRAAAYKPPRVGRGFAMLEPGTMVEGYEVIRLAGSGAMSDVYEGHGAGQVQRVAIKVLHEEWRP